MLINFSNKYFTLVAIIFGIYLIYDTQKNREYGIDETASLNLPQTARYVLEIDPKKPEADKTFVEKMVQKYALMKYAKAEAANQAAGSSQLENSNDAPIAFGDQVTFKLRKIADAAIEVMPLTMVVGDEAMPKFVEEALLTMKQGEIKLVDNKDSEGNIVKYEIKVVSILPKVELK